MSDQPKSENMLTKSPQLIISDEREMEERTKSASHIPLKEKQDDVTTQKMKEETCTSKQQVVSQKNLSTHKNKCCSTKKIIKPIIFITLIIIYTLVMLSQICGLEKEINTLQHSLHNITNQLSTQINTIHHTLSNHQQQYELLSTQLKVQSINLYDEIKKQASSLEFNLKIITDMVYSPKDSIKLGTNETNNQQLLTLKNLQRLAEISNPSLKYLYLWNNKLGDQCLDIIFKAPWFGQLKAIELNGNQLTDKFIEKLVEKHIPNLVWLNLQNNKITDKGMEKLISNGHMLPSLKYINYNKNKIVDKYKVHYRFKELLPQVKFADDEDTK